MPSLVLLIKMPEAYGEEGYLNTGGIPIEKYESHEKDGVQQNVTVFLSLEELVKLKKQIDATYKGTKDLRNK